MNSELHKILMELDYRYDIDSNDYFSLLEEDKNNLSELFCHHFIQLYNGNKSELENFTFYLMLRKEAFIKQENYEMCDLYTRFINKLSNYLMNG
jgi:hypothetical protein